MVAEHMAITASELRDSFDRAYALPPLSPQAEHYENLLAVRLAGDPYAIRVREISALALLKKVVALPSLVPELLGLAGMRGEVIPVYSLAAFLGYGQDLQQVRWLASCKTEEPIGVAFGELDGYLKVFSSEIIAAAQKQMIREHVQGVLQTAELVRPVISLASIAESIRRRCGEIRVSRER